MKKIKKLLAGFMVLAMVVTMLPMLAPITVNADTTTIDTNTEVSLTIYKYRYDGNNKGSATGTMDDYQGGDATIPDGAILLNGVEFKVYKVATIEQSSTDVQLKYKTVDDIKNEVGEYIDGGLTAEAIKSTFPDAVLRKLTPVTKTTDTVDGTNGIAQFNSNDLSGQGLYLVVEGTTPDVVTKKIDPFLVSLPMTNVAGNGWIYNVYAFPKNGTTTGGITLKKLVQTGNDSSAISTNPAQFALQKKINGTWTTITKNDNGGDIGHNGVISVNNDSGTQITGLSQGIYRFVENEAPESGYIVDGAVYEFAMTADGKVCEVETDGTASDTEITNATITVTNYKPTVEKKVLKKGGSADSADDWVDATDYGVGDTVTFKVTSTVPANIANLKHYVLKDTMSSGLTMITSGATITYKNASGNEVTTMSDMPSIIWDSTNNKWSLDLSSKVSDLSTKNIRTIEVTFTATLNADAVTAGTANENYNEIGLEYTNQLYPDGYKPDLNSDGTPDTDVPYEKTMTITDKVAVYTFGIELDKTFTGGNVSNLSAKFKLYRPLRGTEQEDWTYNNVSYKEVGEYTTGSDGKIIINTSASDGNDVAFSNGTYYFVETETDTGYNLLKEPVPVTIQFYSTTTFATSTTVTTYANSSDTTGTATTTTTGTDITTYYTDESKITSATATTTTISVVNNKGFNLPTTGGVGTYIFIFVGVSMMAAAVILFFATKKKGANKSA